MNRAHRRWVLRMAAAAAVAASIVPAHAGAFDDFFTAIVRDDGNAISALLRRGFDPNTRNAEGQAGLTLALMHGSRKAFQALMASRQLQVDVRNKNDESPLMLAALKGDLEAVIALIARDADVNKTGWTPLHYAASAATPEHLRIIALLLERHAYIDAPSPNGTTPLMMAARYGSHEAVELLLNEGADASLRNQQRLSAVDFAMKASRSESADLIAQAVRRRQPNRGRW